MEIVLWIIGIAALVIIGVVAVLRWFFKKGHQGYTKGRDAIRERRDKKV